MRIDPSKWLHPFDCPARHKAPPNGPCSCGLDRFTAMVEEALPDSLIGVRRDGEVLVVVPSQTPQRYTLALPLDQGVLDLGASS